MALPSRLPSDAPSPTNSLDSPYWNWKGLIRRASKDSRQSTLNSSRGEAESMNSLQIEQYLGFLVGYSLTRQRIHFGSMLSTGLSKSPVRPSRRKSCAKSSGSKALRRREIGRAHV